LGANKTCSHVLAEPRLYLKSSKALKGGQVLMIHHSQIRKTLKPKIDW